MIELENDNLGEVLEANELSFVLFGAQWCGNCRMLKPRVKKMSSAQERINFIYVDAEKNSGARSFAKVDNLPTFAIYKGKELINQAQGNKIQIIEDLINEIASH